MPVLYVSAPRRCDHCDNPIETSDWYPMAKERDSDDELRLYTFCSGACNQAWSEEEAD
jgi:hypothetical protein